MGCVGVSCGVDVQRVGRVVVVAAKEVGAAVADGAKVVDCEGAQRDVLVKEGAEGLVF